MRYTTINNLIKANDYEVDYENREISINLSNGSFEVIVRVNKENNLYDIDNNLDLEFRYTDYILDYYSEIWDMHFNNQQCI